MELLMDLLYHLSFITTLTRARVITFVKDEETDQGDLT